MSHHWDVKIGSVHHVVELADAGSDPPWIVACDGVEYMFPKFDLHRRPVVVRIDLDGHPASVTMRTVGATVPQGYVGVGVMPMTTFMTYELVVDDSKRGTWVASEVAGEVGPWAFVKPGGDVPKRPEGLWYTDSFQDPSWGVYGDDPEEA